MPTRAEMLSAALTLPPHERSELVRDIWDSLATQPEALELTAEQERELDLCWQEYLAAPKAGDDWATVKSRIMGQRR